MLNLSLKEKYPNMFCLLLFNFIFVFEPHPFLVLSFCLFVCYPVVKCIAVAPVIQAYFLFSLETHMVPKESLPKSSFKCYVHVVFLAARCTQLPVPAG